MVIQQGKYAHTVFFSLPSATPVQFYNRRFYATGIEESMSIDSDAVLKTPIDYGINKRHLFILYYRWMGFILQWIVAGKVRLGAAE